MQQSESLLEPMAEKCSSPNPMLAPHSAGTCSCPASPKLQQRVRSRRCANRALMGRCTFSEYRRANRFYLDPCTFSGHHRKPFDRAVLLYARDQDPRTRKASMKPHAVEKCAASFGRATRRAHQILLRLTSCDVPAVIFDV